MRGFGFLERLAGRGEKESTPDDGKQDIRERYRRELNRIASSDFGGRSDFAVSLLEKYGGSEDALRSVLEDMGKSPEVVRSVLELSTIRRELVNGVGEDTIPPMSAGTETIPPDTMTDLPLIDHAAENNVDAVGDAPIEQIARDATEEAINDAPSGMKEVLNDPEQKKSFVRRSMVWMSEYLKKNGLTMAVGGSAGFATRLMLKSALGPGMWAAMGVGAGGGAIGGAAREMIRQRKERKQATIGSLTTLVEEMQETARKFHPVSVTDDAGNESEGIARPGMSEVLAAGAKATVVEEVLQNYGAHDVNLSSEERALKIAEIKNVVAEVRKTLIEKSNAGGILNAILDARERGALSDAEKNSAAQYVLDVQQRIERRGFDKRKILRAVLIGAVAGAAGGAFANYIYDHGWFGSGKGSAVALAEEKARVAGAMAKPGVPHASVGSRSIEMRSAPEPTGAGAASEQQMSEAWSKLDPERPGYQPPIGDEETARIIRETTPHSITGRDAFARPVDAPEPAPLTEETPTAHDVATTPEVSRSVAEAATVDPAVVHKGDGFWHVVRRQFAAQKGYSPEDLKDPAKLAEVNRATAKAMARGYTDAEGHHDILNKDGGEARLTEKSIGARITVNESGDIAIAGGAKEMTYPWHSVPDGPAETVGGIEAAPPDTLPVRTFNPDDLRIAPTGRSQIEIIMPEVPLPKRMVDLLNEFGPENARAWAATTNASEFLGDVLSGATGERQVKMAHAIFGLHLSEAQLEHTTMEDLLWKHGAKLKFAFEHNSFFGTKDALSLAKKLGFKEAYEQEAFSRFSVRKFVDSFPPATKDWPAFLRQHEVAFAHERSSVRLPRITKDHLRLARVIRDLGYDRKRLTFGELFADDKRLAQIASMFDKIKK